MEAPPKVSSARKGVAEGGAREKQLPPRAHRPAFLAAHQICPRKLPDVLVFCLSDVNGVGGQPRPECFFRGSQ